MNTIIVKAEWYAEDGVWIAQSDDVPGLAAQSESFEKLRPKVMAMISDLIELNHMEIQLSEIPVLFVAQVLERMKVPAAA